MTTVRQPYTAGHSISLAGREQELVAEWSDFTARSLEQTPGAESFVLIRHAVEPGRFVSFGAWSHTEAVRAWRASEGFRERLGRCRALREQFEGHDYTAMAAHPRRER
jgi:heme-degrading monooxygenase HmoA